MSNLDIIRTNNTTLEGKFACKLEVKQELNRMLVSFQANKKLPGYRWFKYKEGFSATLIHYVFQQLKISSGNVLDPFAGSGTTLFVASQLGCNAVGIELLPIGCEVIKGAIEPKVFSTDVYSQASVAFDSQESLQSIIKYLEQQRKANQLNNPGILRMIRNYFFEMSLVIFECARVLKPGAPFIMVNDNVRYQGANIPVDLILSDIAQQAGFEVEAIWVLPIGKGNSSQQMGVHGREELRKCVYIWRRSTAQLAKQQDRQLAVVL